MTYDTWDGERERLLHAAGDEDRPQVTRLLDGAAESARGAKLGDAARQLEELRALVVSHGLFRSWDEGIWAFSSLIQLIRRMSPETKPPPAYQAFLDAIPGAGLNDRMTPTQTAFWYGKSDAPVYGEIRLVPSAPSKGCALLLVLGFASLTIPVWWLLR